MSTSIDIVVPDLGDFEDVEVIEVLVSTGSAVDREDGLITLETDKAAMDVPSPENGVIEELTVKVGDTVIFGKYAGTEIKIEEKEHVILREDEVLGVIQ